MGDYYEAAAKAKANTGNNNNWRPIGSVAVPTYLCPGEPFGQQLLEGLGARSSYAANAGPYYAGVSYGPNPPSGSWAGGAATGSGGVMALNWGANLAQLTNQDGAANTILVNHVRPGTDSTDPRGTWALGMIGSSITTGCPTYDCYGPNDSTSNSDDVLQCDDLPQYNMGCHSGGFGQATARSPHPTGAPATMCDGSVQWISNSVDMRTWFCLQSRDDAQPISISEE